MPVLPCCTFCYCFYCLWEHTKINSISWESKDRTGKEDLRRIKEGQLHACEKGHHNPSLYSYMCHATSVSLCHLRAFSACHAAHRDGRKDHGRWNQGMVSACHCITTLLSYIYTMPLRKCLYIKSLLRRRYCCGSLYHINNTIYAYMSFLFTCTLNLSSLLHYYMSHIKNVGRAGRPLEVA